MGVAAPGRGDLVWLDFSPQVGHEQAGHRPAVVLSPRVYNARTGLALVAPITRQRKNYPFEVPLPAGLPVSGYVMADQVHSLDWRGRGARLIGTLPEEVDAMIRGVARRLLE